MRREARRSTLPAIVVSCVLVIFSATGLLAGSVASSLAAGNEMSSHAPSQAPTHKATTGAPSATITATTVSSTQLVTNSFVLTLSAAPNPVSANKPVQVTVKAHAQASDQPMAGITCQLEAPDDGSQPLLATWPPAQVTDATGIASWSLDLAGVRTGVYTVGVTSVGTSYTYHSEINVTVVIGS